MFIKFPYTNAHQLNLDWVLKQVKRIPELAASIPTKLSELLNDTGFINATQAAAAAPVQSVNGQTGDVVVTGTGAVDSVNGQIGAVVLDAADVGALPDSYAAPVASVNGQTGTVVLDAVDVGAKPASYTAPVDSVNGQTGAVVLDAADVGAKPASYTAPVASVNGQTGAVVLDAADVGAKPASYTAPVASVNGQTGAVVLDAADVGALPDSYTAPVLSVNGHTGQVQKDQLGCLPIDGFLFSANPASDLNVFYTGISLFGPTIGNVPDTSHWWLVIAAGNNYTNVQVAFELNNTTNPRSRACAAGTWGSWNTINLT